MLIPLDEMILCSVCGMECEVQDLTNIRVFGEYISADIGDEYLGDCPGCQEMLFVNDIFF